MLIRLLLALLILIPALYIAAFNTHAMTVFLAPGTQVTGSTGIVLVSIFLFGFALATIFGVYFALKGFLRERELKKKDANRQAFFDSIGRAREYLAAEDWFRAREEWQQIIRRAPDNLVARIELSRCLEGQKDLRGALKAVEEARAMRPDNIDVLFRAAELSLELENKTAALDNLALILYHHPNKRAAKLARQLSEELERFEDALEYHEKLTSLLSRGEDKEDEVKTRLEYKRALKECGDDSGRQKEMLKTFTRRYPGYAPAFCALSEIEAKEDRIEEAVKLLIKAAKISGSSRLWRETSQLWLAKDQPERALSVIKTALQEVGSEEKINIYLEHVRLLVKLSMLEEAKNALDDFEQFSRDNNLMVSQEHQRTYLLLKSLCLNRMGKHIESSNALKALLDSGKIRANDKSFSMGLAEKEAPSPSLSTP
jgi:tetratricopeptide (TPR) repeat protein